MIRFNWTNEWTGWTRPEIEPNFSHLCPLPEKWVKSSWVFISLSIRWFGSASLSKIFPFFFVCPQSIDWCAGLYLDFYLFISWFFFFMHVSWFAFDFILLIKKDWSLSFLEAKLDLDLFSLSFCLSNWVLAVDLIHSCFFVEFQLGFLNIFRTYNRIFLVVSCLQISFFFGLSFVCL